MLDESVFCFASSLQLRTCLVLAARVSKLQRSGNPLDSKPINPLSPYIDC